MEKVIRKIDQQTLLRSAFESFHVFNSNTKFFIEASKALLKHRKTLRFFNYIRYFVNKKKDMKARFELQSKNTEKRMKSAFFRKWMRQYDIEWNIKKMEKKREQRLKLASILSLIKEVNINKILKSHIQRKNFERKSECFEALTQNLNYMRIENVKVKSADKMYAKNLKQRLILGIKFNLIISKSLRIMENKRILTIKMRAFYGLRWYSEMNQMQRGYSKIVEHKEMRDHFYAWIDLAQRNRRKKELLNNILDNKNYYDQLEAFGIWKRDSFFKTMVSLVDQMIIQPNNQTLMENVIYSWRRAHQFGKVKEEFEQLADANYEVSLAKRIFYQWKNIAAPDMKKYINMKRAIRKITTVMTSKPFYQIISISEKEKVKEDKAFYHNKISKSRFIGKILQEWKNVIVEEKIEGRKIGQIITHFNMSSQKFIRNPEDPDTELTFEIYSSTQEYPEFKVSPKTEVQITLIKSFQNFTETKDSSLLRKYFSALKLNTKLSLVRKDQFEYSSVYYCQNMKRKFLRFMVSAYNNSIDEKENSQKADVFYYENILAKYWAGILQGIRNSKKLDLFEKYQNRGMKMKILGALKKNVEVQRKKILLEARFHEFIDNKSQYLMKHSYFTWKNNYELENYYRTAIQQFQVYRKDLSKRVVFKAIKLEIQVSKRIYYNFYRERRV